MFQNSNYGTDPVNFVNIICMDPVVFYPARLPAGTSGAKPVFFSRLAPAHPPAGRCARCGTAHISSLFSQQDFYSRRANFLPDRGIPTAHRNRRCRTRPLSKPCPASFLQPRKTAAHPWCMLHSPFDERPLVGRGSLCPLRCFYFASTPVKRRIAVSCMADSLEILTTSPVRGEWMNWPLPT